MLESRDLLSAGDLDLSFGDGGIVLDDSHGPSGAHDIEVLSDGKILIAGRNNNGSDNDFALFRYNTDGGLDDSFGTNGLIATDFSNGNEGAGNLAVQNDGKIILAGTTNNGLEDDIALARYNPDGSLDPSFGIDGLIVTDIGNDDRVLDLAIQKDGKLLVLVRADAGNHYLVRYNTDGSLDTNFGTDGNTNTGVGSYYNSIAIQNDDKILIAGGRQYFELARYNKDGSLDTGFGISGKVKTDIVGGLDQALKVLLQNDGKILVGGNTDVTRTKKVALVRYNMDGSLDAEFGVGGIVNSDLQSFGYLNEMALQDDGKIIILGMYQKNMWGPQMNRIFDIYIHLARYNIDGSLDIEFGNAGLVKQIVLKEMNQETLSTQLDIDVQDDEKILISGYTLAVLGMDPPQDVSLPDISKIVLVRFEGNNIENNGASRNETGRQTENGNQGFHSDDSRLFFGVDDTKSHGSQANLIEPSDSSIVHGKVNRSARELVFSVDASSRGTTVSEGRSHSRAAPGGGKVEVEEEKEEVQEQEEESEDTASQKEQETNEEPVAYWNGVLEVLDRFEIIDDIAREDFDVNEELLETNESLIDLAFEERPENWLDTDRVTVNAAFVLALGMMQSAKKNPIRVRIDVDELKAMLGSVNSQ